MELLLFFLLTLLSEILGTVGGFGSSVFFVSLGQFFYSFQTVLALTGILHVFSNTSKIYLFRKSIDWKLVLSIGVSSILFAIAGALLTKVVSFTYAKLLLGLFLIAFSLLMIFRPKSKIDANLTNSISGGAISGFLAGFIGTGGAIRGIVLAAFNLEKNLFVGTSAAIDFGVDLSRMIIYLDNGFFDPSYLWSIPALVIGAFLGSYLGQLILNKISQENFKKIILGLILAIGVSLVFTEIRQMFLN